MRNEKFGLHWNEREQCLYERTIAKLEAHEMEVIKFNQALYTGEVVEVLMVTVPLFETLAVPKFFYTEEEAIAYTNSVRKPYENALINRYCFRAGENVGLSPQAVRITYQSNDIGDLDPYPADWRIL